MKDYFKLVFCIIGVVGIALLAGAVGTMDFYHETGEWGLMTLPECGYIGIVCAVVSAVGLWGTDR